jgi:hypothetical protein
MKRERSPLERQVADVLRRARSLPVGPDRNDLRQLAVGLLWLHRKGKDTSCETNGSTSNIQEQLVEAMPDRAGEESAAG